jgi:preprotein translocase subunit SecE
MTTTTKRSLIALLLSLVLVVSLFTVGISATEEVTTAAASEEVTTTVGTEAVSGTEAASEAATEEETEAAEAETGLSDKEVTLIINAGIIALIIIIAVVLCIKFRKKLGEFMRSVKSEFKKITWASKEQTLKAFLVVIVIAAVFAVVLTLMDLAFNTGISTLADLFK